MTITDDEIKNHTPAEAPKTYPVSQEKMDWLMWRYPELFEDDEISAFRREINHGLLGRKGVEL